MGWAHEKFSAHQLINPGPHGATQMWQKSNFPLARKSHRSVGRRLWVHVAKKLLWVALTHPLLQPCISSIKTSPDCEDYPRTGSDEPSLVQLEKNRSLIPGSRGILPFCSHALVSLWTHDWTNLKFRNYTCSLHDWLPVLASIFLDTKTTVSMNSYNLYSSPRYHWVSSQLNFWKTKLRAVENPSHPIQLTHLSLGHLMQRPRRHPEKFNFHREED